MDPLTIYGIDPGSSATTPVLSLTEEEIAAAGIPAEEPLLLAEGVSATTGMAITLFRLPDGSFQLNTYYADGKPYQIAWAEGDSAVTPLLW